MSLATLKLIIRKNNKPTIWELKGEKIKPCPFCGSSDIHLAEDEGLVIGDHTLHWCSCSDCGCEGPYRDCRLNAIAVWQRRNDPK